MRPIAWYISLILLMVTGCQDYRGVADSGHPQDDGETIDPGDCCGTDEPFQTDDIPWHDDVPEPPDMPADSGPLCDRPGQPGQGRDRDGDRWGELCDCDDFNSSIYPGAPELCDGLDNDCDGQVDPPGTCPQECPNIGGDVLIVTDCAGLGAIHSTIWQSGCDFTISVIGVEVKGFLEPGGFVFIELESPIALACEGRVHRAGFPVGLDCGECWIKVFLDDLGCWKNDECPPGQSCQRVLDQATQNLTTVCQLGGGPNTDNTGEACQADDFCFSRWCFDYPGYCAGICETDQDCPTLSMNRACTTSQDCPAGFRCREGDCLREFVCSTRVIELDLSASGEPISDWLNVCTPVRPDCQTNADCPGDLVCQLVPDPTEIEGFARNCGQEPGAGWLGADCGDPLLDGCATGICLVEGHYCSNFCSSNQDCLGPAGEMYTCGLAAVEVWPGFSQIARVCTR